VIRTPEASHRVPARPRCRSAKRVAERDQLRGPLGCLDPASRATRARLPWPPHCPPPDRRPPRHPDGTLAVADRSSRLGADVHLRPRRRAHVTHDSQHLREFACERGQQQLRVDVALASARAARTRSRRFTQGRADAGASACRARAPSSTARASSRSVNAPRADHGGCFKPRSNRAPPPLLTASRSARASAWALSLDSCFPTTRPTIPSARRTSFRGPLPWAPDGAWWPRTYGRRRRAGCEPERNRPGPDGRQYPLGLRSGEDDPGVGGRLLEELEQGIGGLWLDSWVTSRSASPTTKTLRAPSTGSGPHAAATGRAGQWVPGHAVCRLIQGLFAAGCHGLGDELGRLFDLLAASPALGRGMARTNAGPNGSAQGQSALPTGHRGRGDRCSQNRSWANQSAKRCFPTPSGP
jgi:hypothetical protein